MSATISDFVLSPAAGAGAGIWVQLINNATGVTLVTPAFTSPLGLFTIPSVPPGRYTLNTGPSASGPWTLVSPNYSVPASLDWVNLQDVGGKPDGVTDNIAAFSTAVSQLPNGGTIYCPNGAGAYVFASALSSLNGKSFIRVVGGGPPTGSGSAGPTQFKFTSTSGPLVDLRNTTAVEFVDIEFLWPNTFNQVFMDYDGGNFGRVSGCFFQATGGGSACGLILSFDTCTRCLVERSEFHNCITAIQGVGTSGHSSTTVTVRDCNFSSSTGDISGAMIANPGQGWRIEDNVFELGNSAGNVSIITTSLSNGPGVKYMGNWSGDAATNSATLINAGPGWTIAGNYIGGSTSTTAIAVPAAAVGCAIIGNQFTTHSVGLAITGSPNRLAYLGNSVSSVTTETTGTPGGGSVLLTSGTANWYGAQTVNSAMTVTGTLILQGAERRSIRTPAFATPFTPDATVAERTEMTLTAALTVNAPSNAASGQRLEFWWLENGSGGFAVTYAGAYKTGGWPAQVTTANTMTIDVFEVAADGTTLRLVSRVTGQ